MSTRERPRISVAMCTFNSEGFVGDQLASILEQTRPPDEVVVCDDDSADRTVERVKSFGERAPFDVRLHVNERNLGSTKNFERAIGLCGGDIVVMSGDDDVWLPEKLQRVEEALTASPDAGLALSDAELVDEDLRPMGSSLWEARGFAPRDRSRIAAGRNEPLLKKHMSATYGTTMAFRADYNEAFLPIPDAWVEDAWIALIIAGLARVSIIPTTLVKYRQHGANTSGRAAASKISRFRAAREYGPETFLDRAEQMHSALARLASMPGVDHRFREHVRAMEQHNLARAKIARARARRAPLVARELLTGRYRQYSDGWRSAALDLVRA